MDKALREQIIELLKEELTLDVETTSEYTGGMDGQDLYEDRHTLQLKLGDDVISEVSL